MSKLGTRHWLHLSLMIIVTGFCTIREPIVKQPIGPNRSQGSSGEFLADVFDQSIEVTPFATLTPTFTPTLTPTLVITTGIALLGGATQTPPSGTLLPPGAVGPDGRFPPVKPPPTAGIPIPTPGVVPTVPPVETPDLGATAIIRTSPTAPSEEEDDGDDDDDGGNETPTPTSSPVQVSFSVTNVVVNENGGTVTLLVVLDTATKASVTVDYQTNNGTALAGFDYLPVRGTLSFAPGETSRTITIPILDDTVDDPDIETLDVTLSNSVNAGLGAATAQLEIIDNDAEPILNFAQVTYTALENGTPTFSVTLSRPTGKTIIFSYGPEIPNSGSATPGFGPGADYSNSTGTYIFSPGPLGISPTTFTFQWSGLIDDLLVEPAETVVMKLSQPINVTLGSQITSTLSIIDND